MVLVCNVTSGCRGRNFSVDDFWHKGGHIGQRKQIKSQDLEDLHLELVDFPKIFPGKTLKTELAFSVHDGRTIRYTIKSLQIT